MGDKKQAKKPSKKKLAITKETVQELSEGELDQVAGGVCAPSFIPTGVRAVDKITGNCNDTAGMVTNGCVR